MLIDHLSIHYVKSKRVLIVSYWAFYQFIIRKPQLSFVKCFSLLVLKGPPIRYLHCPFVWWSNFSVNSRRIFRLLLTLVILKFLFWEDFPFIIHLASQSLHGICTITLKHTHNHIIQWASHIHGTKKAKLNWNLKRIELKQNYAFINQNDNMRITWLQLQHQHFIQPFHSFTIPHTYIHIKVKKINKFNSIHKTRCTYVNHTDCTIIAYYTPPFTWISQPSSMALNTYTHNHTFHAFTKSHKWPSITLSSPYFTHLHYPTKNFSHESHKSLNLTHKIGPSLNF